MKNSNHLRQEKEIRLFHNLMATESSHGGFDRLELEGKNVGASMIMHYGSAGESQDCSKVVNSNIQALNNSILAESDVKSRDPGVRLLIEEVKLDGYLNSKKGYKMNKDDDLVFKLGKPSIEKKQWEMAKSPEEEHPIKAFGWAARDPSGFLSPFKFSRRATGEGDVRLKILYCGVCHSDLHFIKNEWGYSTYPIVPGHEIVGIVTEVGSKVRKFKIGDKVGVGCMVGACHTCEECNNDVEQYCAKQILTYNSPYFDGTITYGGYSDEMVALERYCVRFPENMSLAAGAPLLCAGITVYSPLMYYGLNKPGMHVGVAGLGGLGHVAVKFAKALGLKVTVISTSVSKKEEAMKRLGADSFLASRDPEQMQAAMRSMDGIIDTVSAVHPLLPLFGLLKTNGKLVMLGAPEKPLELSVFPLLTGRKMVAGSGIGGMKETQEMVDFAAKHNITADIELIPMDYINTAMERLARGDVRYRFVLDIGNTLAATKP